jgi:hypothetical protein
VRQAILSVINHPAHNLYVKNRVRPLIAAHGSHEIGGTTEARFVARIRNFSIDFDVASGR